MLRNGDFVLQSGELLNNQLNSWFKYHREESVALREAQSLQEESKNKFDARYQQLLKQKEKLFQKQDVLAWRVNTEVQIEAERSKKDPSKAFQFILPDVIILLLIITCIDNEGGGAAEGGGRVLHESGVQGGEEDDDE